MTRTELIQFVRDQVVLNEYQMTDETINGYLNEGFGKVMGRRSWPFALGEEVITSVADQAEYDFVGEPKTIISVLDTVNRTYLRALPLERLLVMQNSYENSTTTPLYFYFKTVEDSKTLTLFPTPASPVDYVVAYRTMSDFSGDEGLNVPPFDPAFHTMLADWATQRAWEREEDMQKADQYRQRFESTLMEMDRFYNTRTEDRPMVYGANKRSWYPSNMPWLNDAANGGAG